MSRMWCLLSLLLACTVQAGEIDPLNSPMWEFHRQRLLGVASVQFDERVRVLNSSRKSAFIVRCSVGLIGWFTAESLG